MKVLIIGASGLLAKPVIRQLDKAGFEKGGELGNPDETNRLLGKSETTFEKWVHSKC